MQILLLDGHVPNRVSLISSDVNLDEPFASGGTSWKYCSNCVDKSSATVAPRKAKLWMTGHGSPNREIKCSGCRTDVSTLSILDIIPVPEPIMRVDLPPPRTLRSQKNSLLGMSYKSPRCSSAIKICSWSNMTSYTYNNTRFRREDNLNPSFWEQYMIDLQLIERRSISGTVVIS